MYGVSKNKVTHMKNLDFTQAIYIMLKGVTGV